MGGGEAIYAILLLKATLDQLSRKLVLRAENKFLQYVCNYTLITWPSVE
jgi:hypothetical protein